MNEKNQERFNNLVDLVDIAINRDRKQMGLSLIEKIRTKDSGWHGEHGHLVVAQYQVTAAHHSTTQKDVDKIVEKMAKIDESIALLLDQLQGAFAEGVARDFKS